MTDGRIPGKWVSEPRFAEMPDATFGFLARAIAWSNEAGTDGHVKRRYLAALHSAGEPQPQVYAALEAAGLWKPTADGYQFISWDLPAHRGGLGQSLASAVQAGKQRNKDKQQRFRDRANTPEEESRNPVTLPGHVGQDTTGQDRLITGEAIENKNEAVNNETAADQLVEVDDMKVNVRTGEIVDSLPIDSPMAIAAQIRAELRQEPDFGYCPPPCGRSFNAAGACPKGHEKVRAA